jgi:hypothetical protein
MGVHNAAKEQKCLGLEDLPTNQNGVAANFAGFAKRFCVENYDITVHKELRERKIEKDTAASKFQWDAENEARKKANEVVGRVLSRP